MYGDSSSKMPITLAMAFSSDRVAFYNFLNMSNSEQDEIISRAERSKSIIEIQKIVSSLSKKNRENESIM
jgi:hypothetical protein